LSGARDLPEPLLECFCLPIKVRASITGRTFPHQLTTPRR
jgi:hypothetical protein